MTRTTGLASFPILLLALGIWASLTSVVSAAEAVALPPAYYLAPVGAVLALIMAYFFYRSIMSKSEGDAAMIQIAQAVREGAYAYLGRQRKIVALVFLLLVGVLLLMGWTGLQPMLSALGVPVAGFLSGLCGYFGMKTATNASARTAAAAKKSLNDGLTVAFRAGAVMGLCVTGFALLDVSVWFYLLTQVFAIGSLATVTTITLSFAMGASLQALFARVGGGIYTKAADVGADLVGKVEAGIPEDDARNPATIADNVGDNVGDVAGMGADLYESYYGAILAAMALAAAAAVRLGLSGPAAMALVVTPAALAGLGILCSIFSMFLVRTKEGATMNDLLRALNTGVWGSSFLIVVGSLGVLYFLLNGVAEVSYIGIWVAILAGLIAGLIIAKGSEIYTSFDYKPTKNIADQALTGPATVIIAGIATGMMSTWLPLMTTVVAILVAFIAAGGNETFLMGVFGVGIAAVGMLATLSITLATDAYGPIADNAGGNAEMSHQPPFVRERTDKLDSLGNTTAAIGKGFAIGSAALTALALLAAYVITVQQALTAQVSDLPPARLVELAKEQPKAPVGHTGLSPVHLGHGLFAISNLQGEKDAGLLLTSRGESDIYTALRDPKATLTSTWNAHHGVYDVSISHEAATLDFEVVPASTATLPQLLAYYDVTLMNPRLLCGLFLGVMAVFLFCSMSMQAVGRAAFSMMQECRRQFAIMRAGFKKQGMSDADIADPMKWPYSVEVDGKRYPDYANCVAISTAGAQREMIVPSLLAIIIPVSVGLVLGVAGTMGLLAGATACGFAVAIFMANAGGAWDNAKKYIEAGNMGGKRSDPHKAAVVGDTVGDPFKDTSGPSLNILIKLMSIVAVVFAGLIVKFAPMIADLLHLG
jgi:H(+)-translocating pyrophosphatase